MNTIDRILSLEELRDDPPVLLDVGASGAMYPKWKRISKHSICIAFDADRREMPSAEQEQTSFKKFIVYNRVVTDQISPEIDFFLTTSPYCSSSLEPDAQSLQNWSFAHLFHVEKKVRLAAMRITDALQQSNLPRIDWFKSDSQGTDLRLFQSLPQDVKAQVLQADFEPGILEGYKGEDRLCDVLRHMQDEGFFMSSLEVKGTQRIRPAELEVFTRFRKTLWPHGLRESPGWAEVTYLNPLTKGAFPRRAYLLTYLFALLERQFGFAAEIATTAHERFDDSFFLDLKQEAVTKIRASLWDLPRILAKRVGHKLLSYL